MNADLMDLKQRLALLGLDVNAMYLALDARPVVELGAQPKIKLPAGDWVMVRVPANSVGTPFRPGTMEKV